MPCVHQALCRDISSSAHSHLLTIWNPVPVNTYFAFTYCTFNYFTFTYFTFCVVGMQAKGNRGAGGSAAKKASKGKNPVGNPLTKLSTGVPQVGGSAPKKASKAASSLGNKASKSANKAASKVLSASPLPVAKAALLSPRCITSLCLPACCVGHFFQKCRFNVEQPGNFSPHSTNSDSQCVSQKHCDVQQLHRKASFLLAMHRRAYSLKATCAHPLFLFWYLATLQ